MDAPTPEAEESATEYNRRYSESFDQTRESIESATEYSRRYSESFDQYCLSYEAARRRAEWRRRRHTRRLIQTLLGIAGLLAWTVAVLEVVRSSPRATWWIIVAVICAVAAWGVRRWA